jgi:hypothetical protein
MEQSLDDDDIVSDGLSSDWTSDSEDDGTGNEYQSPSPAQDSSHVYDLSCTHCSTFFCGRGMHVRLASDSSTSLFSTDFIMSTIAESTTEYKFSKCECRIIDTTCVGCESIVGYHVSNPCDACVTDPGVNHHYWMFYRYAVTAVVRSQSDGTPLHWDTLPAIADVTTDEPFLFDHTSLPEDMCCCICLHVLRDPTSLPCGHTFCRQCIFRDIDLRRKCPLDRSPATTRQLQPNTEMAQRIQLLKQQQQEQG